MTIAIRRHTQFGNICHCEKKKKRTCERFCVRNMRCRGLGPHCGEEGNFELVSRSPCGGPGAASRVTSLTTSYEPSALRNNGRNRILPSCPASQRLLRQTPKTQQYHRPPSSCCSGGGRQEPLQLQAIQVFLPPAASQQPTATANPSSRSCIYLTSREQSSASATLSK